MVHTLIWGLFLDQPYFKHTQLANLTTSEGFLLFVARYEAHPLCLCCVVLKLSPCVRPLEKVACTSSVLSQHGFRTAKTKLSVNGSDC